MHKKIISIICILSFSTSISLAADTATHKAGELSQEHSAAKKTADSQMMGSDADVAVTRKIRDRLTDMDGLSARAQNVMIVTTGKNVTLKGEVENQAEIQTIMKVAKETATGKKIMSQLTVHK